ncbi:translation initiation factor IF-2-like [Orcinus orca]|uniref:Translation initiation factor IF-2-like n=1 Tax=Tursiops truncatus TaxID=9739 RepID=A0A6J3RAB5_TURTR|nr:translation initiation factor IF-2-like [Orcinus orca]XP_033711810.1 translation initiation factor IF-2-like [Tursiops truncatus]
MRGGRGRPRVRGGRCNAEGAGGAPRPGSPGRLGGSAAEPLPFRLGGHQPRALSGRPGQENHREGGRGKAAGGFRTSWETSSQRLEKAEQEDRKDLDP